jgi:hypothetical protein
MTRFRCVEAAAAGPAALGILVPPGRRSLVLLRPRGLDYDLLPVRPGGAEPAFHEVLYDMASSLSLDLYRALEAGGRVEVVALTDGSGYRVAAEVGSVTFLACPREPGRAYRPAQFAAREDADALADRLAAVLCPPPGTGHEVYFNTRNFSRSPEVRG